MMRGLAVFGALTLIWFGCGVDEGPSTCAESSMAACHCDNGALGSQTCAGGLFQPCVCTPSGGSGGSGGFAGFAGTGGAGTTDGGVATMDAGGTGGVGGDGAVGGDGGSDAGGTGGVGGDAGAGGVGGGAGVGGTGGSAATGGSGGSGGTPMDGEQWARCDADQVPSVCSGGLDCYRAAGLSSGPGFCTNSCTANNECSQVQGASVTASCGSESVCRFTCFFGGCPFGMTCSSLMRCNYTN